MLISVVNHSNGKVSDAEVQKVLRAINRQIEGDFAPYWSFGAQLRLEGKMGKTPNKQALSDLRGEAILYLWDKTDIKDAVGYHQTNALGIPYGFVFLEVAKAIGEPWSTTLSHEALEIIGDPQANLLVQGPHPKEDRVVFHWYEMCDAVQSENYEIDGVSVSNFVLPAYFTEGEEKGSRNDFLGTVSQGKTLASFGVNPGGYIGFFDPKSNDYDTYQSDTLAKTRMKVKSKMGLTRRAARYRRQHQA